MGVAHPPGEPLWLAFARVAQLIPVGDIAFRATLLSALCLALCAFPLLALMRLGGSRILVLAALLGLSAQLQAGRPEVYTLTALLLLCALFVACRGGLRAWAALGLLFGLGVGLHPLLFAAAAPALVLAAVLRPLQPIGVRSGGRSSVPAILSAGISGVVGLGVMAWLPLRAVANPAGAWGVPDNLPRFLDVLLARNFAANFGGVSTSLWDNFGVVSSVWTAEGVPCLLLLLLLRLRRGAAVPDGLRAWGGITALWLVGNAATILPQNKVFATNPDVLGYLLVGLLGTLPLAWLALSSTPRFAPLLVSLLLLLQVGHGFQSASSGNFLARSFAVAQSAGLPPGAILMTSGNDTAFTWGYLQRVERRRSDIHLVHRVLFGHPQESVRLGGPQGLAALGLPWTPLLQRDPSRFLADFKRPFFIERRESEDLAFTDGRLGAFGLVGSSGFGEDPWLVGVRDAVLAELAAPEFSSDTEAGLVRAYYLALWGDSP
jgi:hypothetical protein